MGANGNSFYSSPDEAITAPQEEFLYLACLYRGTGVGRPDLAAVVDAEDGRIVHETPMPRRARRADIRAQGPLGERRWAPAIQLRLLVPATQERARLIRVRRAERV